MRSGPSDGGGPTHLLDSGSGGAGSGSGSSESPTSDAQLASATISLPGILARIGDPGFTANDSAGSGHPRIRWVNLTDAASPGVSRWPASSCGEVNTSTY